MDAYIAPAVPCCLPLVESLLGELLEPFVSSQVVLLDLPLVLPVFQATKSKTSTAVRPGTFVSVEMLIRSDQP